MVKKKESIFKSWEDVDNALRELGELGIQKKRIEGEQTLKINEVKAQSQEKASGIETKISELQKNIELFAEEHRSEFSKNRTKTLNFGKISFRYTQSVICPQGKKESAIICLKSMGLEEHIRITEDLNKETLKELDAKILARCGLSLKQGDKINIEPDYVKLAAGVSCCQVE